VWCKNKFLSHFTNVTIISYFNLYLSVNFASVSPCK
jgi:hypothetical protein